MSKSFSRAWLLYLPLVLLAVVSALSSSLAYAQSPTVGQQPQIVYQNLHDGDVLQQPAFGIQLCFASPINIKDLDKGGDFAFSITEPDGIGLGSRDVFQRDGYGVVVYPGNPVGDTAGQWKFHYRVTSPDARAALEGDINYTVDPKGSPFPQETPPVCVASGGTATALPGTNGSTTTPTSGSNHDTTIYALLAIGAAGAAVFVLILLAVRRRQSRTTERPAADARTPITSSTPAPGATPPPVVEAVAPLPQPGPPPASATPPPIVEAVATLPQPSPPPASATRPPGIEAVTPLPQPGPLPASATRPPGIEAVTPLPQPGPPPASATPTIDSAASESARERPDNSRYTRLAIAGAVILLIGLIIRRRGGRSRHRGRPGSDAGKHG